MSAPLQLAGGGCPTRARAAVRLVRFDSPRFVADVKRELNRRGHGAKAQMERDAGIPISTMKDLLRRGSLTDIDLALSIAAWLRWPIENYLVRRDLVPVPATGRSAEQPRWSLQVDWPLVRACAALLCGEDVSDLMGRTGLSADLCSRILAGQRCSWVSFRKLCTALRLTPGQLGLKAVAAKRIIRPIIPLSPARRAYWRDLKNHPGSQPRQIADRLGVSRVAACKMTRRLIRDGWASRSGNGLVALGYFSDAAADA